MLKLKKYWFFFFPWALASWEVSSIKYNDKELSILFENKKRWNAESGLRKAYKATFSEAPFMEESKTAVMSSEIWQMLSYPLTQSSLVLQAVSVKFSWYEA